MTQKSEEQRIRHNIRSAAYRSAHREEIKISNSIYQVTHREEIKERIGAQLTMEMTG